MRLTVLQTISLWLIRFIGSWCLKLFSGNKYIASIIETRSPKKGGNFDKNVDVIEKCKWFINGYLTTLFQRHILFGIKQDAHFICFLFNDSVRISVYILYII
jgi:hypothetical protein